MISVELIDVDGRVRFPPVTLNHPPALQPGMRVAIGESAWEVISCVGARVELRMVRMGKAAPARYATVEETLPPLREPRGEPNVRWIHPQDWRQVELIDASRRDVAERVLEAQDERGVYVRSELPSPLSGLTLADVVADDALGIEGTDAIVAGGFACDAFFGHAEDGMVKSLTVLQPDDPRIQALRERHGLLLVDWCAGSIR